MPAEKPPEASPPTDSSIRAGGRPILKCMPGLRCPFPAITLLLLVAFLVSGGLLAESPYPPLTSSREFRVLNRRFVSQIRFENTDGQNFLTLVVTHGPAYWAFKSSPHALHLACPSPAGCLAEARRLDTHLRSGWNIGLALEGSWIREIVYLDPPR